MSRINEDKINEIRTSINIVHYISQFVNLKQAGQNFKGLCPFHTEKTPSFVVSPAKQIFHCFGCGKGGNIYTFMMEYEKLSFPEALQKGADFAGITLPKTMFSEEDTNYQQKLYKINEKACAFFEKNLHLSKNKKWFNYFIERGLSVETIKYFRLGYAADSFNQLLNHLEANKIDKKEAASLGLIQSRERDGKYYDKFRHRIIFPFQNVGGKVIGFGGRKLREDQVPKYLNSPESPVYKKGEILYGLHQAIKSIRDEGYVVLVEGYFDLLKLVEHGLKNAVASSGTAVSEDQAKLIRRYTKEVYIAYDGDEAGRKAAIRNAMILEKRDLNVYIVPLPAGHDPDSFVSEHGLPEFQKLLKKKLIPIEFQLNEYFAKNKNPSIEDRNQFIQEVLNNLVELYNQIKVGLYIHQLSERLQINESMLVDQLNRLRRFKRRQGPAARNEAPERTIPPPTAYTGVPKAEAGIIRLLLHKDVAVRNFVIEHTSLELIENESFNRIYEFIIQELEETGKADSGTVIQSFQEEPEIASLVSELMTMELSNPMKYAKDCIYQLKKWQLEKKSQEILSLIKEEASSPEALLHYNQELFKLRKTLNRLDSEHRKH